MFGFPLGISVERGVPVYLTKSSVICSDFQGMLSIGGSGYGISCVRVNRVWLALPCYQMIRWCSLQPW